MESYTRSLKIFHSRGFETTAAGMGSSVATWVL